MKDLLFIINTILISTLIQYSSFAQNQGVDESDFPPQEDRYLGQKPPGLIPELFAPETVSTDEHVESLYWFSFDMRSFYFSRRDKEFRETILESKYKDGQWSSPDSVFQNYDQICHLFVPGQSELRTIEKFKDLSYRGFTASEQGNYFFYFMENDGSGYLSSSHKINGEYEPLIRMNESINTGRYKAHPFVATDESYIMWDAEIGDTNTPDIYISFKQPDGSWGEAIHTGDQINTEAYEQRPRVTPDGKYLFFWRGDLKVDEDGNNYWIGNPHWVDAKIIEEFRP